MGSPWPSLFLEGTYYFVVWGDSTGFNQSLQVGFGLSSAPVMTGRAAKEHPVQGLSMTIYLFHQAIITGPKGMDLLPDLG